MSEIDATNNPDPKAFARGPRDGHLRIGCAEDRLIVGRYPANPATFDKAQWEQAAKIPAIAAMVESRDLIVSTHGGKVQVENRMNNPIDIRLPADPARAA